MATQQADNSTETTDGTENMDAFNEAATEVSEAGPKFSAEDISKARAQEKAKLYPQVEKLQEELAVLKKDRDEREAVEADRAEKRRERAAQVADEKKAQQEDELSYKDLLKAKEQEFNAALLQERSEREKAFALLERERDFQELQQYRNSRLEAERNEIIPELVDMISGNSKDEIENSIANLKERSTKIFESVAQASQQSRKDMVGTRATLPASGPLDNDSEQRNYSPSDISNMSAAEYAKNRAKLLGTQATNRGQGLFG